MNGEPVRFLKLADNPMPEEAATKAAPRVIEDFLDQLDGDQGADILKGLLNGDSLIAKHGEAAGRELAAYRLALLLPAIGEAAANLADVNVYDVVVEGVDTTTAVELSKLASN
ncbi:MAG TPA: hypothetical protein VJY84_03270 [Candidatus Saccharimonadales bacterium]|nr:hypothetical protein [Candidatus Saccharimonadales bacterium]